MESFEFPWSTFGYDFLEIWIGKKSVLCQVISQVTILTSFYVNQDYHIHLFVCLN